MKVMIIDDDEGIRASLKMLIQSEGHQVICLQGSTGAEALIAREKPCLVITDHNLGKDEELGLDLAARLLASGQKALLMSANENIEREALSRGVPFFYKLAPQEGLFAMIDMAGMS
jgi:DNA-binding NtrC family response regulator